MMRSKNDVEIASLLEQLDKVEEVLDNMTKPKQTCDEKRQD